MYLGTVPSLLVTFFLFFFFFFFGFVCVFVLRVPSAIEYSTYLGYYSTCTYSTAGP